MIEHDSDGEISWLIFDAFQIGQKYEPFIIDDPKFENVSNVVSEEDFAKKEDYRCSLQA